MKTTRITEKKQVEAKDDTKVLVSQTETSDLSGDEREIVARTTLESIAKMMKKIGVNREYQNDWLVTTTGTATAYTAVLDPAPEALYVGMKVTIIPHTDSKSRTGNYVTLEVNGLGAKEIKQRGNRTSTCYTPAVGDFLKKGKPATLMYDGTYWVMTEFSRPAWVDLKDVPDLVQSSNIKAGENIYISVSDGDVTISATDGRSDGTNVIDDLTSTSATDALSANQGRVLDEKIDEIFDKVYTELPKTWKDVQDIVRAGKAKDIFSIGEQFVVNKYNGTYSASSGLGMSKGRDLTTMSSPKYDGQYGILLCTLVDVNKFVNNFPYVSGTRYEFVYDGSKWSYVSDDGRRILVDIGFDSENEYGMQLEWESMIYDNNQEQPKDAEGNTLWDEFIYFESYLSYGDTISITLDVDELVFDIIGIDEDTPADENYTHSLTLQMHDVYKHELSFDTPEAIYYFDKEDYPEEFPAGDYVFKAQGYYYTDTTMEEGTVFPSMDKGASYKFSLPSSIPIRDGIQIAFLKNPFISGGYPVKLGIYYTGESESIYECEATAPSSADFQTAKRLPDIIESSLDEFDKEWYGSPNISLEDLGKNVNHISRVNFGAGEWLYSDIRQWLNSDADRALTSGNNKGWWSPQNHFDRPTGIDMPGFLYNIEPEFKKVLGEVKHKTTQVSEFNIKYAENFHNGVAYEYSKAGFEGQDYFLYVTRSTEKVFISEDYETGVGYSKYDCPGALDAGSIAYSYYGGSDPWVNSSNDGRIKYKEDVVSEWCLRGSEDIGKVTTVQTDGSYASRDSVGWKMFAPVCVIV